MGDYQVGTKGSLGQRLTDATQNLVRSRPKTLQTRAQEEHGGMSLGDEISKNMSALHENMKSGYSAAGAGASEDDDFKKEQKGADPYGYEKQLQRIGKEQEGLMDSHQDSQKEALKRRAKKASPETYSAKEGE